MREDSLEAMTTNDRLLTLGLMGDWDRAIMARDRAAAISVLMKAGFDEAGSAWAVDTVLGDPAKYGFSP